jgi:uncharacterized protein YndB with AHSA1/START domain
MIDVVHEINASQRTLGDRVIEAGEARSLTITRTYRAAVDDVWDACTNPERIPRWFLPISGDLELGGRFKIEGNAGGTIEACDPPNSFRATWEYGGDVSWIELRLTAEAEESTRFELEHIARPDDRWKEFGPGAVGIGWDLGLIGLGHHLGSGEGIDPAEGAAWAASPEGVEYMKLSSDAWCQAEIASGADPDDARKRAANTLAAYTGG